VVLASATTPIMKLTFHVQVDCNVLLLVHNYSHMVNYNMIDVVLSDSVA
jgi:hypothetical protein